MSPGKKDMTTIWVSKTVKEQLDQLKRKHEPYNQVIERLLRHEGEVWFDLLSVDGEQPYGHEIIFKLGNMTYRCIDGEVEETAIKIVPVPPPGKSVTEMVKRRSRVKYAEET